MKIEKAGKLFVDGVPVLYRSAANPKAISIHVPAFGQEKEQAEAVLDYCASAGFAAIAIDAFQHGERGSENREEISRRVFSSFRKSMWTIIGLTALDLPSISDWARDQFGRQLPVHLTGLSMGGDTVIAAAPLIDGVASVNAVIATPDWTRPGMRDIATGDVIDQGAPDRRAGLLFEALNPDTHSERYRTVPIRFIVGGKDTHVPPEPAFRFAQIVNEAGGNVSVMVKPDLSHLDFVKIPWWLDFDLLQPSDE